MTGRLKQMGFRAAGAAALIPSSAPGRIRFIQPLIQSKALIPSSAPGRIRFIQPLIQSNLKELVALAQTNPDAECGYL